MKAKAIKDLCQLTDADLFKEVSEGIDLIIDHASQVEKDAKFLAEHKKKCGLNILKAIIKEEAAKFLILLDAIRCTKVPPEKFTKQLQRFNDHLAKGIYSLVYDTRPAHFKEIHELVESECHEYYLDGPNDVDWIFRNEILQKREEHIYVDYIESDGDHFWLTRKRYYHPDISPIIFYATPKILEVAYALWKIGCTKPDSLSIIAEQWRTVEISDDSSWQEIRKLNHHTLEKLASKNLIIEQPDSVHSTIIDNWLFPLHSLDIRIIKVDKSHLKEARDKAFFQMYY